MNGFSIEKEQVLNDEGILVSTTSGISMYPLLRDRRDTVIIKKPTGRLKKYDVPLYRRGDQYVLHRIIKVLPDSYIIRGDNCEAKEYGITDSQIIGVLDGIYRGDKYIPVAKHSYRLYAALHHKAILPVKVFFRRAKRVVRRFIKG